MKKGIANLFLAIALIVFLYYMYMICFNVPTDMSELADLQIQSAIATGVAGLATIIRIKIKK
ncbi:hypothetical protein [Paenibacillus xylanexedens]|uniref:hypothetical protein n=1 Tax=Paenibacillus xylanexedens TaxID=528191 RepID=UPI0011A0D7A9|nr:hypothetical protein [Paenibacillus xylanexedens]